MKKRTLLFVHISTHFKEMFRVAKVLKKSDKYEPIIFFDAMYEGVKDDIQQCILNNIDFIKEIPISNGIRPSWPRKAGFLLRRVISLFRKAISLFRRAGSLLRRTTTLPRRTTGLPGKTRTLPREAGILRKRIGTLRRRAISYLAEKFSVYLGKIIGYELVLMLPSTKVEPRKLYIELASNDSLKYTVIDPSNKELVITSYITRKDFQETINEEGKEKASQFFNTLQSSPHDVLFSSILLTLLNITSKRGHTRLKIRISIINAIKYLLKISRKIHNFILEKIKGNLRNLKSMKFFIKKSSDIFKSCLSKFIRPKLITIRQSEFFIKKNTDTFKSCLSKFIRPKLITIRQSEFFIKKNTNTFKSYLSKFIKVKICLDWLLKRKFVGRLCLVSYKYICKVCPDQLPAISRTAFNYVDKIPCLISTQDIKLMIFPEHNLFYFTQLFVYKGRQYNIPSIIIPFTIANTIEWSEAFYKEPSRSMDNIYNKILSFVFPNWVHVYKNRQLILPIELILFHEMLGITPKNPWLLNSGDIDFLAVESNAMKDYYISAGIEAEKLRAIGALYNDELFQQIQHGEENRFELYKSLNLADNKPMMLCALPPNQMVGREELVEFKTYEEIVRCIIAEMCKYAENFNIIINLHPRTTKESVAFLNEYPVKISSKNIAQLVPLSSLYIASCSATIRMAISCGIPVINYDLYKYNYDDYIGAIGVVTMTDKIAFIEQLQALALNKTYYQQIKTAQENQSEQWGKLDGKVGETLLAEIDKLFNTEIKSEGVFA